MFTAVTSYLAEESGECWRVLDRSKKCIIDKRWPGALRLPTHSEYQYKDERGELVSWWCAPVVKMIRNCYSLAEQPPVARPASPAALLYYYQYYWEERGGGDTVHQHQPNKEQSFYWEKKIFSQEKMLMTEAVVGVVKDSADDNSDNFTSPPPPPPSLTSIGRSQRQDEQLRLWQRPPSPPPAPTIQINNLSE